MTGETCCNRGARRWGILSVVILVANGLWTHLIIDGLGLFDDNQILSGRLEWVFRGSATGTESRRLWKNSLQGKVA